jgi:hypothetical protein
MHTIRYFVELEIDDDDPGARNRLEEAFRSRIQRWLRVADRRIVQSEVVYIPQLLADRPAARRIEPAAPAASPFDGRGVLQDGSTPERMR